MPRLVRLAAGGLLLGMLFTACTIEPSDLGAKEERYLQRIEKALAPMRKNTEDFERVYQKTKTSGPFDEELEKIPFRSRVVRMFKDLRKITPPPRFFGDQRRLLEAFVDLAPVASAAEELVREGHNIKASARYSHAYVIYDRALTRYSSRFCLVAASSKPERDLCDPVGILPGAGYGDRLHAILARASAEFVPRGFQFVGQVFNNSDVARYLQSIGPSLVKGVEDARDAIRQLVPPDEFASDHRVIEEYFTDITRVSQRIIVAANRNPGRLHTLFPESQRLVRQAGAKLSDDIRPAVAVWFFPSG
jgi:hypothetical protein